MKKLLVLLALSLIGCEAMYCDCEYVTYENNPQTNGWVETYRSYWDASCYNELLDNSVYTDYDGGKWYTKTYIECN